MKLTICYLPHRPFTIGYADIMFNYLCKIKPEYKSQICVKILYAGNWHLWNKIAERLVSNGIETYLGEFPFTLNYMDKIILACESDTEYCCKIEEDVWINNYLWEYIIDNLNVLDDDKNVILSPLLSLGIPHIEDFIEGIGSTEEIKELYDMFHTYKFIPVWGADYTPLNITNETTKEWNKELFYSEVNKLNHYYKGIHPLKLMEDAQMKINDLALNHYDKIIEKQKYSLNIKPVSYFTNTLFFIKTQTWKKIINTPTLFKDAFDEVPINLYAKTNDLNCVFTNNGYGIHIFNNCLKNYESLQHIYYKKYIQLL